MGAQKFLKLDLSSHDRKLILFTKFCIFLYIFFTSSCDDTGELKPRHLPFSKQSDKSLFFDCSFASKSVSGDVLESLDLKTSF